MRGFYCTIIFSFLLLSSCNYHIIKNSGTSSQDTFSDSTTVGAEVVQDSVLNVCLRCHSGTISPALNTLSAIKAHISKISDEVTSNAMPPADAGYKPLSDCAKDILQEWINEGMPDTSTKKVLDLAHCHVATPAPTPQQPILEMPLTYETLTTEILQPRCLHCHNLKGDDPDAADIALYPFASLNAQKNMLGPSATSKLYKYVSLTNEDRMPPPEDGAPLTAEQIEFIKKWLDAGAPEK